MASTKQPITKALATKRAKWLAAVEAGDLERALEIDGQPYPPTFGNPEINVSKIDSELLGRALDQDDDGHDVFMVTFNETLTYWGASPVEIMLRSGNRDGLAALIRQWGTPERRCYRGYSSSADDLGWTSQDSLPWRTWPTRHPKSLVALAALRGDEDALRLMVRGGLCPSGNGWDMVASDLRTFSDGIAAKGKPQWLENLGRYGITSDGLASAGDLVATYRDLNTAMEEAFDPDNYTSGGREQAYALLAEGAPVDYYPLMIASELGDLEMLERLFDAGGDPNCRYKTGVPALARLIKCPLETKAVWLARGASPLMYSHPKEPDFGDEWCPSPLMDAVWGGNLELTRLFLEKSVVKQGILYEFEGEVTNPMVELATERGHKKVADYLFEYVDSMEAA